MWQKTYRPYTPSRRYIIWDDFADITKKEPHKPLTKGYQRGVGKNHTWRTTSRFKWWWHKRRYRQIDRKGYDKLWIPGKVASIEYDPWRSSRVSLIHYRDGEKRYVLTWKWCKVGDMIMNGEKATISPWNRMQLANIPEWMTIYNLEFTPFTKWKTIKSAWWFATIMWKWEKRVTIKMSSGEIRKFNIKCRATIGQVGNEDHKNMRIGKAWRNRRRWKRPHNRGKSMNPVDHPHGGGEWGTSIGMKYPKASNGRIVAPGIKTRKKKKWSTKFIVTKRKKKRR